MEVVINDIKYKIIENEKDGFDLEELKERITDYFYEYDYVVGDWAYGKLRLKGFNNKGSKNYNKFNDYSRVNKYIEDNCAYGCKYFILERIKD